MKTRTHYATLGLASNATPEVIRAAYKALTLMYFDQLPEMTGAEGVARAAVLEEVQEAFAVLDDQSQKAVYDAELAGKDDEVIDEASAFHHPPQSTMEDCTTAPTIEEQKNSMRARVHEQVKYWRGLRERRHEAEARLSVAELKSLVEIWEEAELENAADPVMKAQCAILTYEYVDELKSREQEYEERPADAPTPRRTTEMPTTPVAMKHRPKTPCAPTKSIAPARISSSSKSDVAAQKPRFDASPTPAPCCRMGARAAEHKRAEEKRVEATKGGAEARKERKAQIEAARQAALDKKTAAARAFKAEQKAAADERAHAKAEHIAKARAKVRGRPVDINDATGDFVASGEQEDMLSHGVDASDEGMSEDFKLQADKRSDACGTEHSDLC
ncbi:uncharacterized protein J4E79_008457 [Alternaria viburni]|uniref:uncharacterized protein n=1 Tax=Alternaria viburni TaxID=566460 RepID=UPI0020C538FB|nr:uncharacterized protein J4E79_008457 [Alternaria viburni]KAI4654583.1 hypothetical protein J4E79_008457 [Alternaria viburni]